MKTPFSALALAMSLTTVGTSIAHADSESDFLLFLSADNLERHSVMHPDVKASDFTPTIDFLLSYNNGPWRILGEYFVTDDEAELERLQLGYEFSSEMTLWFGRFHQPISAWNHRYHHGAYLQPSISRPSVENWEDDDGVIPSHVTGLMLETWQQLGENNGIRYAASVGYAPTFERGELLPYDILDPDEGASRLAGSLNVAYYPDVVREANIGLIAGYSEIEAPPSVELGTNTILEIRQKVLGAQANWEAGDWQFITAAYYFDHKSHGASVSVDKWFMSGYVQALLELTENTSTFARMERTRNSSSPYLQLFPQYVHQREILGFRWDFAKRQALAIELSGNRVVGDKFSEFRVQWSAAFP